jgi:hypothetical protein
VKTRVDVCGCNSALAAGLGIGEWLGYSRLDSHVAELVNPNTGKDRDTRGDILLIKS